MVNLPVAVVPRPCDIGQTLTETVSNVVAGPSAVRIRWARSGASPASAWRLGVAFDLLEVNDARTGIAAAVHGDEHEITGAGRAVGGIADRLLRRLAALPIEQIGPAIARPLEQLAADEALLLVEEVG